MITAILVKKVTSQTYYELNLFKHFVFIDLHEFYTAIGRSFALILVLQNMKKITLCIN